MAKSLRSKRKRKIRAEKRIVNAKKELVKLREVAAKLHQSASPNGTRQKLTKESLEASIPDVNVCETMSDCVPMSVDGSEHGNKKGKSKINNQWMNQRRIKAIKNKIKVHNKKKGRRSKSAGLSSRKVKKGIK